MVASIPLHHGSAGHHPRTTLPSSPRSASPWKKEPQFDAIKGVPQAKFLSPLLFILLMELVTRGTCLASKEQRLLYFLIQELYS